MNMTKRSVGILAVVISALGFAAMPLFARLAYADGVNVPTLLFLRFTLAAGFMLVWVCYRHIAWPPRQAWGVLVGMGAIGYAGQAACYFTALQYATAGMVALLLYVYPLLVTLLATVFLRERLNRRKVGAVALGALGGMLTIGAGGQSAQSLGIVLGLGAAFIYAGYVIVSKRAMSLAEPTSAGTVVMLATACVYALWMSQAPAWPHSWQGWSAVVGIALFSTILAMILFLYGMTRLDATEVSTLSTLEPLMSIVLGVVFLRESFSGLQAFGGGIILLASLLLARAPSTTKTSV